MHGVGSLVSLTPHPLCDTTATVFPILHQRRHQGEYQPRGCQVFALVSKSSRGKKSSFCNQVLATLLIPCPGLILNITRQPTEPSLKLTCLHAWAPQTPWTPCLSSRQWSAVLLCGIWLVVNGALSPCVVILDVFIGEILNYLGIIKVC